MEPYPKRRSLSRGEILAIRRHQTALCCRCALAVRHAPIYFDLLGEDGWYIEGPESIAALLTAILNEGGKLDAERARAFSISKERLDYRRFSLAMTGGL